MLNNHIVYSEDFDIDNTRRIIVEKHFIPDKPIKLIKGVKYNIIENDDDNFVILDGNEQIGSGKFVEYNDFKNNY